MKIVARGNRLASLGQAVSLEVSSEQGVLVLRAPFYRAEVPLAEIMSVDIASDDGRNHGYVNWFVTGSDSSPGGVRLNTGGKARVEVVTVDQKRYVIVLNDMEQARNAKEMLLAAGAGGRDHGDS